MLRYFVTIKVEDGDRVETFRHEAPVMEDGTPAANQARINALEEAIDSLVNMVKDLYGPLPEDEAPHVERDEVQEPYKTED